MGKTILLVDDDPLVLRANERVFKRAGWEILMATGVKEALKLIAQADVVLSDFQMPDGTGDDVVRLSGNVPVVILTGSPEDVKHTNVVVKPADNAVLLRAVSAALEKSQRSGEDPCGAH